MKLTGERLAVALSRQIVEALVKIGLAQDDILRGEIKHTDLPWQVPPLVVEATLFDVPLSAYLDQPMYLNMDVLHMLWSDALLNMRNSPYKVLKIDGTYISIGTALHSCKNSERPLYLSIPEGFPGSVSDMAAAVLSLEVAHLVHNNAKFEAFVSDDSNYYATLAEGLDIGLKNGLPALWDDIWDLPMEGMAQELLRTPRGAIWEGCDHDIIAKVRSLTTEHRNTIRDFEAIDWALQALRVVAGQRELLNAVRRIKQISSYRAARKAALEQSMEVMDRVAMTDRQKIETLKHLLVPEVISITEFSRKMMNFYTVPAPVVSEKVTKRIKESLVALYDNEVRLYGKEEPLK